MIATARCPTPICDVRPVIAEATLRRHGRSRPARATARHRQSPCGGRDTLLLAASTMWKISTSSPPSWIPMSRLALTPSASSSRFLQTASALQAGRSARPARPKRQMTGRHMRCPGRRDSRYDSRRHVVGAAQLSQSVALTRSRRRSLSATALRKCQYQWRSKWPRT
jgi:hypothetical protein